MSLLVGSVRPNIVKPPRAIPWKDVQSILRVVDRRRPVGKRDYAMLLLMASYGLGRAEVAGLSLDDIDWYQRTLRIVREKNELEILLPLSDAVAKALASYLQYVRPPSAARRVFLRMTAPHTPLAAGSISPLVRRHAAKVGVKASPHTLRHSHACRQIELNAPPKSISDILGHTDPESLSTYVRVAHNRLRQLCLPLP
jgi:integrase